MFKRESQLYKKENPYASICLGSGRGFEVKWRHAVKLGSLLWLGFPVLQGMEARANRAVYERGGQLPSPLSSFRSSSESRKLLYFPPFFKANLGGLSEEGLTQSGTGSLNAFAAPLRPRGAFSSFWSLGELHRWGGVKGFSRLRVLLKCGAFETPVSVKPGKVTSVVWRQGYGWRDEGLKRLCSFSVSAGISGYDAVFFVKCLLGVGVVLCFLSLFSSSPEQEVPSPTYENTEHPDYVLYRGMLYTPFVLQAPQQTSASRLKEAEGEEEELRSGETERVLLARPGKEGAPNLPVVELEEKSKQKPR